MTPKKYFSFLFFMLLALASITAVGQDDEQDEDSKPNNTKRSKLRIGMYLGTMFPAGKTASFYDGWGYDIYGNRNDFQNSFMRRSIVDANGGNFTGQHDNVADALGVDHGEWHFNEDDMPTDMRYATAFVLGAHAGFSIGAKNSILLNFTTAKLTANGAFTIVIDNTSPQAQQPGFQNIRTFGIEGSEQRFMFQLGYQHVFGEEGGFNFFTEGGAVCTMSKFLKNQIAINNLIIDLGNYYDQVFYEDVKKKYLSGLGFGAWGGCGFTTGYDARAVLQFVYNPTLETIAIGQNTPLTLQHYIGLRIYYSIWRRTVVKESF